MRDITLGETIYPRFSTRAFATGVPTTLAGTPVISAYEENNTTEIIAGVSISVDYDSRTGFHQITVVATAGNGYEAGKSYDLVITTGTVGGVSVVGEVVGQFTVQAAAAFTRLGAPAAASIAADLAIIDGNVDDIELDTAAIDAATAGLGGAAMRGTDSAALASVATEGRLAELDAANLPTDIAAIPTTAMRGTDNAALAAVVGALADAAASGDPTASDTLMQYAKQLINVLIGAAGVVTWPAAAAPANGVSMAEGLRKVAEDAAASLADTADMQPKIGTPAADLSADVAAVKAETASIQAETTPILADTADMQPKLGTPAADLAADVAAIKTDTAAVLVDTGTSGVKLATDALDNVALADNAAIEIANKVWATLRSGQTAAGSFGESYFGFINGVAEAGTLSITQMTTDATEATDDHFKGRTIIWLTGVLAGQGSDVTAYLGSTGMFTYTAITEAPGVGDRWILV